MKPPSEFPAQGARVQPPRPPLLTVADVIHWYSKREFRQLAATSQTERERQWSLFCERYGLLALHDACADDLLDFIRGQEGVRSNWTRRRIRSTICKPFNEAATLGRIARNPFGGLKIPEGKEGRDWTDEEYQAILRNAHPYFRRLIVFVRFSGARPGEARTLEWQHIRSEIRAIIQREHKTDDVSKDPRRIRLNHVTLGLLAWLWRHRAHERFVFVNGFGRPWTIKALTKHLLTIRRRIGIAEGVKMHGGRHTYATRGLMRTGDIYTMSKLLGHASVKTTEKYLHLIDKDDFLDAAAERVIGGKYRHETTPRG